MNRVYQSPLNWEKTSWPLLVRIGSLNDNSVSRAYDLRPRRRLGHEHVPPDVVRGAAWGVEALPQSGHDLRRALDATQRHDRATEPRARESRPLRPRLPGQLHEPVQLGVAHVVVVPQTLVRRVEYLPERSEIPSCHRRLRLRDA